MPFKSQAQRAYMYIHHPAIAKRWSREYPNQGKLPKHAKKTMAGTSKVAAKAMKKAAYKKVKTKI